MKKTSVERQLHCRSEHSLICNRATKMAITNGHEINVGITNADERREFMEHDGKLIFLTYLKPFR